MTDVEMVAARTSWFKKRTGVLTRRTYAVALGFFGLAMASGGLWLAALGGSTYYVAAGAALLACAWLTWAGAALAAPAYAAILLLTTVWAFWESGVDRWALAARLFAPALLGLGYLLPPVRGNARLARWACLVAPAVTAGLLLLFAPWPASSSGQSITAPVPLRSEPGAGEWPVWGRDDGGTRYSPLAQITGSNVSELKVAWTYRTGRSPDGSIGPLKMTPLKVGDHLYICGPTSMVDALDAETGKRIWRFDPKANMRGVTNRACRGVAYQETDSPTCPRRIIATSFDAKLWALDAKTGRPCTDFGQGGSIDLTRGMGPLTPGEYFPTSAPAIAGGKIVIGGWVYDGQKTGSAPGVVRAYDLRTGEFAWAWDIGRPGITHEPRAKETYTRGSPNSWAPMSTDPALGLVYIPTGNATPDYYGAHRSPEFDRYSSSVVALDIATGKPRWSFQTVHHDVWDYDVPSQPTLLDIRTKDGVVPGLLQPTKHGQIYVLDRRTGRPIIPVAERPAPQNGAPGERLSSTQPVSALPSVAGPDLSEERMWGITPLDQLWCRIQFRKAGYAGPMTPPQVGRTTLQMPGLMGAVSWGGVAVDPHRQIVVVNSNRVPTEHRLLPRAEADRLGVKPRGTPDAMHVPGYWAQAGTQYAAFTATFASPLGIPCSQPPYGVLTAIDLTARRVLWEAPLGTARDSGLFGLRSGLPLEIGVPNTGGALVTASGLIFISATQEESLRAVDMRSGRTLWSDRLPAGGNATPMTYRSANGRQFVVIAAGGNALLGTRAGDYLIAYALPTETTR